MTSHDMTWHLASNHITSPHVTSQPTTLLHLTPQPTTSKQVTTSPPWNGWRLLHSKHSVWASQWLVTLCTFYRQFLSLTYCFFLWNLRPRLARLYLYIIYIYIYYKYYKYIDSKIWNICYFNVSHMYIMYSSNQRVQALSFQASAFWASGSNMN